MKKTMTNVRCIDGFLCYKCRNCRTAARKCSVWPKVFGASILRRVFSNL